jgi:catechol 2,3-dioxygenase-like lactoylglutathione lyase family enzyme
MPFERVHHVKYTVSNMDRSIAFYRDLLGFTLTYDATRENVPSYDAIMDLEDVKVRVGMMEHPPTGFVIGLVQFHNPVSTSRELKNNYIGASSLALQVTDCDAEYRRLRAEGVDFVSPPTEIVRDGKAAAIACYALDPDKIPVELWQPLSP